jgi:predicted dehydrogenase
MAHFSVIKTRYETVLRWLGAATQVVASGETFVKTRIDPESGRRVAVTIPDHLTVAARMACGAQATFLLSRVTGHAPPAALTLYGSEATLRFQNGRLTLGRRTAQELRPLQVPEEMRGGWRVEEAFVNAIRGRESVSDTTFAMGVKYMGFTEAVARSLAEGRAVPVPF